MGSSARLLSRLGCLVALAHLASVAFAAAPAAPTAAAKPVAAGPLKLADDEFWGDVQRTRASVVAEIGKSGFHGILIDAPKRVIVASRQTLPVAGYFVRSLRDDRLLDQQRQMVVVAQNLQTGQVLADLAFKEEKEPVPSRPPPGDAGEGTTLNAFTIDARKALQIPWTTGSYGLTVVLGRFVSSTIVVQLQGDRTATAEDGLQQTSSDTSARKPAITLARKGTVGCKITGEIAATSPAGAKLVLLLTGSQTPGQWAIAVDVPPAKAKQPAPGKFAIDLLRSAEMPRIPQSYFVYGFAGRDTAGPVDCARQ